MKILLTLGLVLVSMAVTADAAACLRQSPVSAIANCFPPRNALIFTGWSTIRCCASRDLYPFVTARLIRGKRKNSCSCVPANELCAGRPNRCIDGGDGIHDRKYKALECKQLQCVTFFNQCSY